MAEAVRPKKKKTKVKTAVLEDDEASRLLRQLPEVPDQLPEKHFPEEQLPVEQLPEEQLPEEQLPEEQLPVEQLLEEQLPEEQLPEEQLPEEQLPVEQLPVEHLPVNQTPEDEIPDDEIDSEQQIEEPEHSESVAGNTNLENTETKFPVENKGETVDENSETIPGNSKLDDSECIDDDVDIYTLGDPEFLPDEEVSGAESGLKNQAKSTEDDKINIDVVEESEGLHSQKLNESKRESENNENVDKIGAVSNERVETREAKTTPKIRKVSFEDEMDKASGSTAVADTLSNSVRFLKLKDDVAAYPDLTRISLPDDSAIINYGKVIESASGNEHGIGRNGSEITSSELHNETSLSDEQVDTRFTQPGYLTDMQVTLQDTFCEEHFAAAPHGEAISSAPFPTIVEQPKEPVTSKPRPRLEIQHRKILVPNIPEMGIETSAEYPHYMDEVNLNFDLFMRPFTSEQLRTLYNNPMLEHQDQYVEYFVQECRQEQHPFYELVLNYYRARNKFVQVCKDITGLEGDIRRYEEQVWAFPEKTIKIQGQCADKVTVTTTHAHRQAEFNQSAVTSIDQSLRTLQNLVYEDVAQQIYTGLFARLQVESYIHSLYAKCPFLRDIPFNAPVQALFPTERPYDGTEQVSLLKCCISVLFIFLRKPNSDDEFRKDLQLWLSRMVASLLRVATYEDHMFLLHQLLRSPPGATTWAAAFIQVPEAVVTATQFDFGGPLLDHAVAVLASLMSPVKYRSDLLLPLKVTLTPCKDMKDVNWTLVDSDGEEDEEPEKSWYYLAENDVVRLLDQVPLDTLYRHVLGVDSHTGQDVYNICRITETGMLKVFAFSACVLHILGEGLHTYNLCRYRQLNKRIGRMIRHTLQYVTDHWLNFQCFYTNLTDQSRERLQMEYDQLYLKATRKLLSSEKLGSWQFLADLPYTSVSMVTMWRLLWLMCHGVADERTDHVTPELCLQMLEDEQERARFEETLTILPVSEAIYLNTTLAHMARSRHALDHSFVAAVTTLMFQVSYVWAQTRQVLCKSGRELISSVAMEHPFTMSLLLTLTRDHMTTIGTMALHLWRDLPLYLWQPSQGDYDVIAHWLLDSEITMTENRLGRHVLQNLNWGASVQAPGPALDSAVHQYVACLLLDVTVKHIVDKHLVFAITEGVKQVTMLRGSPTEEQLVCNWAWDLAFTLRLHVSNQLATPSSETTPPQSQTTPLLPCADWQGFRYLNLDSDDLCVNLKKALGQNKMFANYLVLVMTDVGHDQSSFCQRGVPLLSSLVSNGHSVACVHVLDNVLPVFYTHPEVLVLNDRFQTLIHQLVQTDQSYSKLAKNLLYADTPPQHVTLLAAMVQHHLQRAGSLGEEAVRTVTVFWVQLLTKLPKWNLDRNICYLLDQVCMTTFISPSARLATEAYFFTLYKSFLESQTGLVSSMFSWLASGNALPSLSERAMPDCPYLMYMILLAQTRYEDEVGLWPGLLLELIQDSAIPVESAVKKVCHKLKLPLAPIAQKLCIYRWLEQAGETPADVPLAPVFWQQFFLRYLGRPSLGAGMSSRGGIGERFFTSWANTSIIKTVKTRLRESVTAFSRNEPQGVDNEGLDGSGGSDSGSSPCPGYKTPPTHAKLLASMYETFGFWLDEPRLHDPALYLPALPSQYQPDRLALVFDNRKALWLDCIDFDQIRFSVKKLVADWTSRSVTSHIPRTNHKSLRDSLNPDEATARLLDRLSKRDPIQPPPALVINRPPVQDVDKRILADRKGILFSLHNDLDVISRYAKLFSGQLAKFVSLNADYVDFLPKMHTNEQKQMTFKLECTSLYNLRHKCAGPAEVVTKFSTHRAVETVISLASENRSECKQLVVSALMPPPENVCAAAVHVENTIAALIDYHKSPPANQKSVSFLDSGQVLFYHLVSMVSGETTLYIPTRQFFCSCIEILGQEFIMTDPSQCSTMLETILERQDLCGMLSPNFVPNLNEADFVTMYARLGSAMKENGPVLVFMLLSKFDVSRWLDSEPDHGKVRALYSALSAGFRNCGAEPADHTTLVFGIYRQHFGILTGNKFPDNLFFALGLLLEGTSLQEMSVSVWEDLLRTLAIGDKPDLARNAQLRQLVSISVLADISVYLYDYFSSLRRSSADYHAYGLYPVWSATVPYYSRLCTWLAETYCDKLVVSVHSAGLDVNQGVELFWDLVTNLFSPWLVPTPSTSPWIQADAAHARTMVATFTRILLLFSQSFSDLASVRHSTQPLSLVWHYYATKLAVIGCPGHVIELIQAEFLALPWQQFAPDLGLVDTMIQLYDHEEESVFAFTSEVFSTVCWPQLVSQYLREDPLQAEIMIVKVLELVVRFATRPGVLQKATMPRLLSRCEDIPWCYLSPARYQDVCAWYLEHGYLACVLDTRGSPGAQVLGLLKRAGEFPVSENPGTGFSHAKHCIYVRLVAGLLSRCSHHEKMVSEKLTLILSNILTDIETAVSNAENKSQQEAEATALLSEVLILLNNCNPRSDVTLTIVTSYRDWVTSSADSVLLFGSVVAACGTVASVDVLADILYTTCTAVFLGKQDESIETRWQRLVSCVNVPELCRDDFIKKCLEDGYYMLLSVHVMQLVRKFARPEDEYTCICTVVGWFSKVKPNADNERELVLLVWQLLQLVCRQLLEFGVKQSVMAAMIGRLSGSLAALSEDRTSGGLLGAIGLGKRSALSVEFRLIARSMATYLLCQVTATDKLRLTPSSPGAIKDPTRPPKPAPGAPNLPTQQASDAFAALESLKSNKLYASVKDHVIFSIEFVSNPVHSVKDSRTLLAMLVERLFGGVQFLKIIR